MKKKKIIIKRNEDSINDGDYCIQRANLIPFIKTNSKPRNSEQSSKGSCIPTRQEGEKLAPILILHSLSSKQGIPLPSHQIA